VSDQAPEAYLVGKPVGTQLDGGGTVQCVACHTVSRSGKKLFAFTQAASTGEYTYDVTLTPPPQQRVTTQISTQKGFGTFSPDDSRVVASVGNVLGEFDSDTGASHGTVVSVGTNPDWSPTGTELAYSDKGGDSPGTANLKLISTDGGAWGGARILVPAAGLTNLFPSFSPDGQWVVYVRGKGGHGDLTLQLWLAKADGSLPPVELITANRVVNSVVTSGRHENNMPTWAPEGDLLWLAFNSVRPYGVVIPNGGQQQIWVAAIDPSKLGTLQADGGLVDPSFPAFRFAFQGLGENNHRAFWTLDVRVAPDGGSAFPDAGSTNPADAGPSCGGLGDVCATSATCCAGLVCDPSELVQSCQPPRADGGVCLAQGAACSQTGSGATCCTNLVCDVNPDGGAGTVCQVVTIN
jgi:Tol biopolymer transport system component